MIKTYLTATLLALSFAGTAAAQTGAGAGSTGTSAAGTGAAAGNAGATGAGGATTLDTGTSTGSGAGTTTGAGDAGAASGSGLGSGGQPSTGTTTPATGACPSGTTTASCNPQYQMAVVGTPGKARSFPPIVLKRRGFTSIIPRVAPSGGASSSGTLDGGAENDETPAYTYRGAAGNRSPRLPMAARYHHR